MGRPSLYSPELVETICSRLEGGESLAGICREDGMPAIRTFLQWAHEKEEVATVYSRALEARAEWAVAEHERIRVTALDKDSASAARVQLSALEWQMSKMAPKKYGDFNRLDVTTNRQAVPMDETAVAVRLASLFYEVEKRNPGLLDRPSDTPQELPE